MKSMPALATDLEDIEGRENAISMCDKNQMYPSVQLENWSEQTKISVHDTDRFIVSVVSWS